MFGDLGLGFGMLDVADGALVPDLIIRGTKLIRVYGLETKLSREQSSWNKTS